MNAQGCTWALISAHDKCSYGMNTHGHGSNSPHEWPWVSRTWYQGANSNHSVLTPHWSLLIRAHECPLVLRIAHGCPWVPISAYECSSSWLSIKQEMSHFEWLPSSIFAISWSIFFKSTWKELLKNVLDPEKLKKQRWKQFWLTPCSLSRCATLRHTSWTSLSLV